MRPNLVNLPIRVTPKSASGSPYGASSPGQLKVVGEGTGVADCCLHRR